MTFLFLGDPELTEEQYRREIWRLREAMQQVAELKNFADYRQGFEPLLDDAIEIAIKALSYDATKPSYLNVNAQPDVQ